MSSPAKRRRNRLARQRAERQEENRRWNKKSARGVHVLSSNIPLPGNMRDITPKPAITRHADQ
jgi:hypothetical protein